MMLNSTLVRDADGVPLHFLSQMQDITESRRHEAELRHMADHDPLTGLLNRRSFERELERHVSYVERDGPEARRSCSTSTTSRRSTTRSATPPATS